VEAISAACTGATQERQNADALLRTSVAHGVTRSRSVRSSGAPWLTLTGHMALCGERTGGGAGCALSGSGRRGESTILCRWRLPVTPTGLGTAVATGAAGTGTGTGTGTATGTKVWMGCCEPQWIRVRGVVHSNVVERCA
jgi:hypothetical protein